MKKIVIALVFALMSISAFGQITFGEGLSSHQCTFKLGDYVFTGTYFGGHAELSCRINDYDESESVADFISSNRYEIGEKYGVTITNVREASGRSFDERFLKYRYGNYVVLEIETAERGEYLKRIQKEKEDRLNNLNSAL